MHMNVPVGLQESNLMVVNNCRARRAAPAGLSGSQGMAKLTDLGQVGSHGRLCLSQTQTAALSETLCHTVTVALKMSAMTSCHFWHQK